MPSTAERCVHCVSAVLALVQLCFANPTVITKDYCVPPPDSDLVAFNSRTASDSLLVVVGTPEFDSIRTADQRVAPTWSSSAVADSFVLTPSTHCIGGPCLQATPSDARVVVRGVSSMFGMALQVVVTDDAWVQTADSTAKHSTDRLCLYLNTKDPTNFGWQAVNPDSSAPSTVGFFTRVYEFNIGGGEPCQTVSVSYYDENAWSWQERPDMSISMVHTLWGEQFEWVHIDSHTRVLECVIWWGIPATMPGPILAGQYQGISVAYHDRDAATDSAVVLSLRGDVPSLFPSTTHDPWGLLSMSSVNPYMPKPWPHVLRLVSPDSSTNRRPTVSWEASDSAQGYRVHASVPSQFSYYWPIAADTTLRPEQTTFTPRDTLPAGLSRWHLAALPNSTYITQPPLTITILPLQKPYPVFPPRGSTACAADSLVFTTQPSRHDSIRYVVELARSAPFDTSTFATDTLDSSPGRLAEYAPSMTPGVTYWWRVRAIDRWHQITAVAETSSFTFSSDAAVPRAMARAGSREGVRGRGREFEVRASVPASGLPSVRVYDSRGRLVRELTAQQRFPGQWRAQWDGCDYQGHAVPSGSYVIAAVPRCGGVRSWMCMVK